MNKNGIFVKFFIFLEFLLLFLFLFLGQSVRAGDAIFMVEESYGDQSAWIVAKVESVNQREDKLRVRLVRLVSGKLEGDKVTVLYNGLKREFQSRGIDYDFKVGDDVLLSIQYADEKEKLYKIGYDYACKRGKIKEEGKFVFMNGDRVEYEDILLEWFCNTGEDLDISDGNERYYRVEDGKRILVYEMNDNKWHQNYLSSKYVAPDIRKDNKIKKQSRDRKMIVTVGAIIFFTIGCFLVRWKVRKSRIRHR